jgi:hypothetical protein
MAVIAKHVHKFCVLSGSRLLKISAIASGVVSAPILGAILCLQQLAQRRRLLGVIGERAVDSLGKLPKRLADGLQAFWQVGEFKNWSKICFGINLRVYNP